MYLNNAGQYFMNNYTYSDTIYIYQQYQNGNLINF